MNVALLCRCYCYVHEPTTIKQANIHVVQCAWRVLKCVNTVFVWFLYGQSENVRSFVVDKMFGLIFHFGEKGMVAIEKRISTILVLATSTEQFKHFLCNVQFVGSECIHCCHFTRKTSCFSPIRCKSNSNLKRSEYVVWLKGKKKKKNGSEKRKIHHPKQPNLIKLLWTVSIHLMHTDHERMANRKMWRPLKNGGTMSVYCYKKLSFFCKNAHKDNLTVCYAREKLIMWHNPVEWLCNCGERNWQSQTKLYSLVCLHSEEKCNFNQHFRSTKRSLFFFEKLSCKLRNIKIVLKICSTLFLASGYFI